jgi:hypothetical protein
MIDPHKQTYWRKLIELYEQGQVGPGRLSDVFS